MIALALGIGSSLCWGLADFLGGLQSKRTPALVVVAFGQLGALIAVAAGFLLTGHELPGAVLVPAAIAGTLLSTGLAAFYRALATGTMGVVAPIVATGSAVPVLVGLASGEKPGVGQGCGLALAVVGVVLAVRSRDGAHRVVTEATSTSATTREPAGLCASCPRGLEPVRTRASSRRGVVVWLAAGAAVAIGTSLVFLKHASESDVFATLLVSRAAGLMTIAFALAATRTSPRLPPSRTPALLAIGVLDMLATALFAFASTQGLLSVVAVASSLYPAVTVVLARLTLDERLTRTQVAGIVSVLLGVCLIAANG